MNIPSQTPAISVCIPTYNGSEHLAACIDSIRSQTFADFEVVICDDQSSDGTLDFARKLGEGDNRFRFIANPRRLGLAANWNNCVQQARGEWIKFVFQDDTIAPACLETLLGACLDSQKPFGFCDRDFIFGDGTSEKQRAYSIWHKQRVRADYSANHIVAPEHVVRIAAGAVTHNLVGEPTVTLIRKSLFNELGAFDEALIQLCDSEFWCRVMIHHGAVFVPESLAAFRIHAKATTTRNNRERAYRGQTLDGLVIWYRTAFAQQFKPMRNAKVSGKSALWFRTKCAYYAAKAWKQARWASNRENGNLSESMMAEWKTVRSSCPGLQLLSYVGLVIAMGRKIKMTLSGSRKDSNRGKADTSSAPEGLVRAAGWRYPKFLWRLLPSGLKDWMREMRVRILTPYLTRHLARNRTFEQSPHDAQASECLSIIVPVHDAPEMTRRCLESLEKYAPIAEIILVDDGSKLDGTKQLLADFAKRNGWKLISNLKPQGHSAACGAGATLASRPFFCLLNSDTVVTPWCWRPIIQAFESDSAIGVAGPSTSSAGTPQALHLANFTRHYLNDSQICDYARLLLEEHMNTALTDLPEVSGFAFFIRRSLWEQLGGFDRNLPDYRNETELCGRILGAGYRAVWVRNSYIHHFGGASYTKAVGQESIWARIRAGEEYVGQKRPQF